MSWKSIKLTWNNENNNVYSQLTTETYKFDKVSIFSYVFADNNKSDSDRNEEEKPEKIRVENNQNNTIQPYYGWIMGDGC